LDALFARTTPLVLQDTGDYSFVRLMATFAMDLTTILPFYDTATVYIIYMFVASFCIHRFGVCPVFTNFQLFFTHEEYTKMFDQAIELALQSIMNRSRLHTLCPDSK
jgi:hypothetical protein